MSEKTNKTERGRQKRVAERAGRAAATQGRRDRTAAAIQARKDRTDASTKARRNRTANAASSVEQVGTDQGNIDFTTTSNVAGGGSLPEYPGDAPGSGNPFGILVWDTTEEEGRWLDGYEELSVTICENGSPTSGTILFKEN